MASRGNPPRQCCCGCRDMGIRNKHSTKGGKGCCRGVGKTLPAQLDGRSRSCEGRALSNGKFNARRALCSLGVCRSRDAAYTSLMPRGPCRTLTPHISALCAQTSQEQPTESVAAGLQAMAAGLQSCYFQFFLCGRATWEPKKAQDLVKNTLRLQVMLFPP